MSAKVPEFSCTQPRHDGIYSIVFCFVCFLAFFVLILTNSVSDDNERDVFCYAQVKGWYGKIFTDGQRTLLFPFCALQQNSYFKSKATIFLFSHAFVMETNSQKCRAPSTCLNVLCTHMYRMSVCCTGCLSNAYLNAFTSKVHFTFTIYSDRPLNFSNAHTDS